jgi:2,4-dienoyl-CoA reductase (NADPH2)
MATGAKPIQPDIPGVGSPHVIQAWDVLRGNARVGQKVAIVGGNAVGLETALYLANRGTLSPEVLHFLMANRAESYETLSALINKGIKEVTVVEMFKKTGKDIGPSTRWTVMAELRRLGVTVMINTKAVGIRQDGLELEREDVPDFLPADSIVIAVGSRRENALVGEVENLVSEVHTIGDAKEPRNALEAIREGFLVGLKI